MAERFNFDGHIHCPPYRIEKLVSLAIDRGLDALCITERVPRVSSYTGNFDNFDLVKKNEDNEGNRVLNPKNWDIEKVSPLVLKLTNEQGFLYLLRGGEVHVKQGDLLTFGIKENTFQNKDITEVLKEVDKQGGIAVFPHLYSAGCGERVFRYIYQHYPIYLTGLEINGQFPKYGLIPKFKTNLKVKNLVKQINAPLFGFSDIHAHYLWEHKRIGKLYYSSFLKELIDTKYLLESFKEIMINHKEKIEIKGHAGSTIRSIAWKAHSVARDPKGNAGDLFRLITN